MKLIMYSVYDSKIEAYINPIFARSHGEALRRFEATARDEESDFHRYAADYTLMAVGEWDDERGKLTDYEANITLANAIEYAPTTPSENRQTLAEVVRTNGPQLTPPFGHGTGAVRGGE